MFNKKKDFTVIGNKEGILILPENYYWCSDCNAITPHDVVKENFHMTTCYCKICGNDIPSYGYYFECPNCKWSDESIHEEPNFIDVIVHKDGCHMKKPMEFRLNEKEFWEYDTDNDWRNPYILTCSYSGLSYGEYILESFYNRLSCSEQKRLKNLYNEHKNVTCDCPSYPIIINPNVYNYRSASYVSYDCMNAIEWSYDVRCPICGCVFEIDNSNC